MDFRSSRRVLLAIIALSFSLALLGPAGCADSKAHKGAAVWTMIGGSETIKAPGTATWPGARSQAVSWTDGGDLWLFGGLGMDFGVNSGDYLNDLWRYDPALDSWTMAAGSATIDQPGSAAGPGSRLGAASWAAGGKLWLFGGEGYDFAGTAAGVGKLNDLWRFTPNVAGTAGSWAMIDGDTLANEAGTASSPGARSAAAAWADTSGNLWLFGGSGYDFGGNHGYLNDLWKFDTTADSWSKISGADSADVAGTASCPGGRSGSAAWADASGNLWLFGGRGLDFPGNSGKLNDLWKFDISGGTWTLVAGSTLADQAGTSSCPGSRYGSSAWTDPSGDLWLFGGRGFDFLASDNRYLNDLWKFHPDTSGTTGVWTLIAGTSLANQLDTTARPGGRFNAVSWMAASGDLWLFGGEGFDFTGPFADYLNDLWKYGP
jgi:hypothetical protein